MKFAFFLIFRRAYIRGGVIFGGKFVLVIRGAYIRGFTVWFKRTDSKIFVARTAIISVRNMFCLLVDRFLVMWLTEF